MGATLFENTPAASCGPTFGTGARSGIECFQRQLVAAVEHKHEINEAIEAGRPGGDASFGVGGCVRDEKGGGEMQTAAQDVLIHRRGLGCARLAGEDLGHESSVVSWRGLHAGVRWAL